MPLPIIEGPIREMLLGFDIEIVGRHCSLKVLLSSSNPVQVFLQIKPHAVMPFDVKRALTER